MITDWTLWLEWFIKALVVIFALFISLTTSPVAIPASSATLPGFTSVTTTPLVSPVPSFDANSPFNSATVIPSVSTRSTENRRRSAASTSSVCRATAPWLIVQSTPKMTSSCERRPEAPFAQRWTSARAAAMNYSRKDTRSDGLWKRSSATRKN